MQAKAETFSKDNLFAAGVIIHVLGAKESAFALMDLADISVRFVQLRCKLGEKLNQKKASDEFEELLKLTGEAARRLGSRLPKLLPNNSPDTAAVALASPRPRSGAGIEGGAALASRRRPAAPLRGLYVPVTRKVSAKSRTAFTGLKTPKSHSKTVG